MEFISFDENFLAGRLRSDDTVRPRTFRRLPPITLSKPVRKKNRDNDNAPFPLTTTLHLRTVRQPRTFYVPHPRCREAYISEIVGRTYSRNFGRTRGKQRGLFIRAGRSPRTSFVADSKSVFRKKLSATYLIRSSFSSV